MSTNAATIFENGLANVVNTPIADEVIVRNDTDVMVETGGSVTAQSPNTPGITVQDSSTVTVNGGTVTGAINSNELLPDDGHGIAASGNSQVTINGGVTRGGNGPTDGSAGNGVSLSGNSSLLMTGGTVEGGARLDNGSTGGASGAGIRIEGTGTAQITGGTVRGGLSNEGGFGTRSGLVAAGADTTIDGGSFTGGDAMPTSGVEAVGGDGVAALGNNFLINDGVFTGGSGTGLFGVGGSGLFSSFATGVINGGTFTGGVGGFVGGDGFQNSGSDITINGGAFTGGASGGASLGLGFGSVTTLRGGLFDGVFDVFADSFDMATLNIFGSGLSYDNGLLSGTLQDGSTIFTRVTGETDFLTVVLNEVAPVPLPAGLPLLASGLVLLAFGAGRKRRQRT